MKACTLLRFCYSSSCCTNSAEISSRREPSSTSEARLCRSALPTQRMEAHTIPVYFGTEWRNLAEYFASIRPVLKLVKTQCLSLDSRSDVRLAAFHERTPALENASPKVRHGGVRSGRRLALSVVNAADAEFLRNLFIFFSMLYGAMTPVACIDFKQHLNPLETKCKRQEYEQ